MASLIVKKETSPVVETKSNVKLVKKETSPFDEGGCFTSALTQFIYFKERKFSDILKEECFYISSAFSQEPLIFTEKERNYLSERLEWYFNHVQEEMKKGKTPESASVLLNELVTAGNKEAAFQLLEEMARAREGNEEIEVVPMTFSEAKKAVLKGFQEHCQLFLLQLKEISTRY